MVCSEFGEGHSAENVEKPCFHRKARDRARLSKLVATNIASLKHHAPCSNDLIPAPNWPLPGRDGQSWRMSSRATLADPASQRRRAAAKAPPHSAASATAERIDGLIFQSVGLISQRVVAAHHLRKSRPCSDGAVPLGYRREIVSFCARAFHLSIYRAHQRRSELCVALKRVAHRRLHQHCRGVSEHHRTTRSGLQMQASKT